MSFEFSTTEVGRHCERGKMGADVEVITRCSLEQAQCGFGRPAFSFGFLSDQLGYIFEFAPLNPIQFPSSWRNWLARSTVSTFMLSNREVGGSTPPEGV